MSLIHSSLLLGAGAAAANGNQIERSLRFNSSDSGFLSRTPASAGNRKTWTWAGWVKRSAISGEFPLLHTPGNSNDAAYFRIYIASDQLSITTFNSSGGTAIGVTTTQVFRDPSAWMHFVIALDTTQAIASERLKIYVNGTQVTQFSLSNWPTQNTDYGINSSGLVHYIGLRTDGTNYANGYLADIYFIDGQALTPSSFTEVSATTGQLIPKAYTGTFTGNSFWLKFSDNSSTTSGSNVGIGKDFSGLGNYWNSTNLSVTAGAGNDSLVDTPTSYGTDTGAGGEVRGNYATLNPLDNSPAGLSNGNLDASSANAYPTIIPGSGSWYYEVNGTGYSWDGTRSNWTPRAGSHNFGQRAFSSTAPSGFKALCDTNLPSTTITTSGSYTGNGVADGPFVYLNGVPTAMTIGGNAVTFGTHADKLSNGFKIRTSSTTYNQNASSYSYSITSTGAAFKNARAQPNP